jgi:putative transposase
MMGFHLGFDPPSSQVLALALRHAILPKHYDREYNPHSQWGTYGVPRHLTIGGESNMKSVDLEQIAVQLGLVLHQHHRPIDVAIVERFFTTSHTYFFSMLPGYTGSEGVNYLQADLRQIGLTLPKLEQRLVGYIVNNYNQSLDERYRDPTRFQRWQAGLLSPPRIMRQEDFDI